MRRLIFSLLDAIGRFVRPSSRQRRKDDKERPGNSYPLF
jgi:hypothetical protein